MAVVGMIIRSIILLFAVIAQPAAVYHSTTLVMRIANAPIIYPLMAIIRLKIADNLLIAHSELIFIINFLAIILWNHLSACLPDEPRLKMQLLMLITWSFFHYNMVLLPTHGHGSFLVLAQRCLSMPLQGARLALRPTNQSQTSHQKGEFVYRFGKDTWICGESKFKASETTKN